MMQKLSSDSPLRGRIVSMLVLGFAYAIAEAVLFAVVIAQVLFAVFGGAQNGPLQRLGYQIAAYVYQILMFLTFNSEDRPFPYQGWGDGSEVVPAVPVRDPRD